MAQYTTPHSLPVIEPAVDNIKQASDQSKLAKDINAVALAANAAISVEGGRAEQAAIIAASSDATAKADAARNQAVLMAEAAFRNKSNEQDATLAQQTARIGAIETLGGLAPGDVSDATITDLLANPETTSGALLEARIDDRAGLSVRAFGAVGDGSADDTAAIRAAFMSGRTIRFDEGKVYAYAPDAPLVVTAGTRLMFNGAQLYEKTPIDEARIVIKSNVYIDRLDMSFAGGDAARGVQVEGTDIHIGSMRLTARARAGVGNFRRRALTIGKEGATSTSRVHMGDVYIENWDYALGVLGSTDVTVGHATIRNYLQGVWIKDSRRVKVNGGSADILSGNAKGNPGENAIVVEAAVVDGTGDLTIRDFKSYVSGEHGFRLGGQVPVKGVTFDNCYASKAGSGVGSGNEPDNHGGCGFKALGPTSNLNGTARHEGIRFINCTAENLTKTKQKDNFAGFNLGKCYDVQIVNPVVRAVPASGYGPGTYAAYNGIELIGCENVVISEPILRNCANAGISFYDSVDGPTVNWGDHAAAQVIGGHIRGCRVGVEILAPLQTIRRLKIDGTEIEGGEYALFQTAGTSSLINRCSARITAYGPPSIATTSGMDNWLLEIFGDEVGTNAARAGSQFTNYSTGDRKVRKGGAWVTV